MKIIKKSGDYNIILNKETDFYTNAGWEESLSILEDEIMETIINPIENYDTTRYIHKPYNSVISGLTINQTDIWYYFYFLDNSGTTYTQDYNVVGIETKENAKMLKQSTESFFKLEFYKTPNNEQPTRKNRKLVFSRNLSLPLGEKYFYNGNNINEYIHFPVFTGSNYRNTENMYLFWFQDETVLSETRLSGTTFFMTAKFFNADNGTVIDFTNKRTINSGQIREENDLYYLVEMDRNGYTYQIYDYYGFKGDRIGYAGNPINFYEKGGASTPFVNQPNNDSNITIDEETPTPTTPTVTPTITPSGGGSNLSESYYVPNNNSFFS